MNPEITECDKKLAINPSFKKPININITPERKASVKAALA